MGIFSFSYFASFSLSPGNCGVLFLFLKKNINSLKKTEKNPSNCSFVQTIQLFSFLRQCNLGLFAWCPRKAAWPRQRAQASDFGGLGSGSLPGRRAAWQGCIQTSPYNHYL